MSNPSVPCLQTVEGGSRGERVQRREMPWRGAMFALLRPCGDDVKRDRRSAKALQCGHCVAQHTIDETPGRGPESSQHV